MDKFIVVNDSCEYCAKEYIEAEAKKLADMPDDQKKTQDIHRIIHGANRASCKPVISLPCREQQYDNYAFHKICADHLYKMIDAIKEYEDYSTEKS